MSRGVAAGLRFLPNLRGKAAVARRLQGREKEHSTWSLTCGDFHFELPSSSTIAWRVAATGEYDTAEIAYLRQFIEPETTPLDVGGSLGLWAIPLAAAAQEVGGELEVFEPMPANVRYLTRNLELNGLRAAVHQTALGSADGSAQLGTGEAEGGNAVIGMKGGGDHFEVSVRRLDDFERSSRVSFIKLDVEGFEVEVLRGAMETIRRDKPVIFGEFSPEWLSLRQVDPSPMIEELKGIGYSVAGLRTDRVRPWLATRKVELGSDLSGGDLLFRP